MVKVATLERRIRTPATRPLRYSRFIARTVAIGGGSIARKYSITDCNLPDKSVPNIAFQFIKILYILVMSKQPPLTSEQLRARAQEYREMAGTANSADIADGLIRLAERFESLAKRLEEDGSDEV
jgi:hypothetical protein